jgi:hypothetical protein
MTTARTSCVPPLTHQPDSTRQNTIRERAAGCDVAEAATGTGMVIRAEAIDPGRLYDTRMASLDPYGRAVPISCDTITAHSAVAALIALIDNEYRSGGLDQLEVAALAEQLNRLNIAILAATTQPTTPARTMR